MFVKIIYVLAVISTSQVFALQLNVNLGRLEALKNATGLGNSKNVSKAILQAYKTMDDFGKHITLGPMKPYLKRKNPQAPKCFEKQKSDYENFITEFSKKMRKIGPEIALLFEDNPEKSERIQKIFNGMALQATSFESKFKTSMEKGKFRGALKHMKHYRDKLRLGDLKVGAEIIRLNKKFPEKGKEMKEKYNEVRNEAKEKSKEISDKIKQCVETEGPE